MRRAGRRTAIPATRRPIARLVALGVALASAAGGQEPSPVDTTGLGAGPSAAMSMLFEKTIFRVDVLTLDVRLGVSETARLDSLFARADASIGDRQLADSVASVALDARDAWARIEFRRGVGLRRFLDGIRENLDRALEAGIITRLQRDGIVADLPGWYAFLAERGIRDGDRMFYRVRGDTLHTAYRGVEGELLLDQVDVGPERRLAVLGGYFAPGSDFRRGLVESMLGARDPERDRR